MARMAIGIAQGALDDVLGLAAGKVPLFAPMSLAGSPLFQHDLATADARLRAARAVVREDAAPVRHRRGRRPVTPELRARARAAANWATDTAAAVVDAAYSAGGGTSSTRPAPCSAGCATSTR